MSIYINNIKIALKKIRLPDSLTQEMQKWGNCAMSWPTDIIIQDSFVKSPPEGVWVCVYMCACVCLLYRSRLWSSVPEDNDVNDKRPIKTTSPVRRTIKDSCHVHWSIPCDYYKYIKSVSIKSYLQTLQRWQTKRFPLTVLLAQRFLDL